MFVAVLVGKRLALWRFGSSDVGAFGEIDLPRRCLGEQCVDGLFNAQFVENLVGDVARGPPIAPHDRGHAGTRKFHQTTSASHRGQVRRLAQEGERPVRSLP